jgi:predicted secreted protein
MPSNEMNGMPMSRLNTTLVMLCTLSVLSFSGHAELQDQGLNSIMQIIDKAIEDISNRETSADNAEADEAALKNATTTVVNLSRTLGTLSYSRLQCGEADVLSEFTQRVQKMPEQGRDAMRDAFQEGFDKSKDDTQLLSEDECARLTQARVRTEAVDETNVVEENQKKETEQAVAEKEPELPPEEPRLRHLRIAELSGQLAYKRKICDGEEVFTRDYNAILESVPDDYLQEVKDMYWKGYKHGKRMNPDLTSDTC